MAGDARLVHAVESAEATGDVEAWFSATVALGGWRAEQGGGESASSIWRTVSDRLDRLRASYRSRGGRLWAGQVVERELEAVAPRALREIEDPAEALLLVESLRARTLLDEMCLPVAPLPAAAGVEAARLEADLLGFELDPSEEDEVAAEMQLISQLSIGSRWMGITRDRVEAVERIHAEHGAGLVDARRVATAAEVQSSLRQGEALLEFFIPYHSSHPAIELWALIVTSESCQLAGIPLDRIGGGELIGRIAVDGKPGKDISPLGNLVIGLRRALIEGHAEAADAGLALLDETLIAPLADAGLVVEDCRRLIVVPHRLLHPLPWPALIDSAGRRLAERTELGIAPSASVFAELRGRAKLPPTTFLGLADPPLEYAGKVERLEDARKEVEEIGSRFEEAGLESKVFCCEGASEATLAREVAGKSIVHIATHAGFPSQTAVDTHSLLLARTAEHDGVVHARELSSMDLSSAWVATLSVCNGGLYRFGPGDEPYGLLRALLVAGARNVLATIWPVDDKAAPELTVPFSAALLERGPAGALNAAERRLSPTWPVRHWAAFALVGAGL